MGNIRHNKLVSNIWFQGYIVGFLSKAQAQKLLLNAELGTFLIRFSERSAGNFAIAFVKKSKQKPGALSVKHYLIKPDDLNPANRNLADFFGRRDIFKNLMQITPQFSPTGAAVIRLVHKDDCFSDYYTKSDFVPPDGYDAELSD